jgi:2,3-diketo-5-methylthio-1-phosphopentane phosphatase
VIEFTANTILLDIEGTLAPVSYVYDVLFPYALENARSYLERCWDDPNTLQACDLMALDAGFTSSYDWLDVAETKRADMISKVVAELERLAASDAKSRGLKELQGIIWAEAYASGKLCSKVFEDVPQALACWKASKMLMAIYSSGSATAQREFFGHTEYGSLTDYFAGFFDTSCGPKRDAESYKRIIKLLNRNAAETIFMSDIVAELDAAREAGLQTLLLLRPGNAPQPESDHQKLETFYDLRILQPVS